MNSSTQFPTPETSEQRGIRLANQLTSIAEGLETSHPGLLVVGIDNTLRNSIAGTIAKSNPLSGHAFQEFKHPDALKPPGHTNRTEAEREADAAAYEAREVEFLDFKAQQMYMFLDKGVSLSVISAMYKELKTLARYEVDLPYRSGARYLQSAFQVRDGDIQYEVGEIVKGTRRNFKRSEYFKKIPGTCTSAPNGSTPRTFEMYSVLQGAEDLPEGYSLFLRREIDDDKTSDYRLMIDSSENPSSVQNLYGQFDGSQLMFGYGSSMAEMAAYLTDPYTETHGSPVLREFNRGFDNAVDMYIAKVEQTGAVMRSLAFMSKCTMYIPADLLEAAKAKGLPAQALTYSVIDRRDTWKKYSVVKDNSSDGSPKVLATGLTFEDATKAAEIFETKSDSVNSITYGARNLLELQLKIAKLTLEVADEIKVQRLCVKKLNAIGVGTHLIIPVEMTTSPALEKIALDTLSSKEELTAYAKAKTLVL